MNYNQIYSTSRYEDFIFREANRPVDEKHAKKIAENMKENGWKGAPIEVSIASNNKLQIEDGQHRYTAAKMTGTPIRFMIVDPLTIYEVATQNSTKKGWTRKDYISAYAMNGNYSYKRMENLINEFKGVTVTDIITVITANSHGTESRLKKGYVIITDEQFYKAREVLTAFEPMVETLKQINIKTMFAYKRALIALLKHDIIDPERMMDKMDKHGAMLLPKSATQQQAIEALEVLYNYHMVRKNIVYFRERLKNI